MPRKLGLCGCPGRRIDEPTVVIQRELGEDLARLKNHYGVTTLVSLVGVHELRSVCGLPRYEQDVRRAGLEFVAFPMVDMAPPENLEQTVEFVKGLEGLTQRGEVLAVHCKAGNGRAGTIAGCWLLERGDCETAADAIRMVRQRRSAKAIQSYRQEKFIGAYEERLATVDFLSRRESMDWRRA